MALEVTDDNFDEEVLQSETPVLVDFWAPWCGPCRMLAPTIDEIATEYDGKAKVVKLNTDASGQTATKLGIQSIPTLIVFKGGEVVERLVGALPKAQITSTIDKHL